MVKSYAESRFAMLVVRLAVMLWMLQLLVLLVFIPRVCADQSGRFCDVSVMQTVKVVCIVLKYSAM